MVVLKYLVNKLYLNSGIQPKILGPGGFFDQKWFIQNLQVSGPNVVDIISHHIYNLGPGVDPNLFENMQDPYVLDNTAQTYKDVDATVQNFGVRYLDQLGMASSHNHQAFCRQILIGGNYGLLNTTTMVPNPDYYSALLFHRLMGTHVLDTTHNGSPYFHAYSHCSRHKHGVTLLLISLSNSTSLNVSIANDLNFYPSEVAIDSSVGQVETTGRREEYHLTAKDGNLKSTTMLLNGIPLELTCDGEIPPLKPVIPTLLRSFIVAHSSIVFVTLREIKALHVLS